MPVRDPSLREVRGSGISSERLEELKANRRASRASRTSSKSLDPSSPLGMVNARTTKLAETEGALKKMEEVLADSQVTGPGTVRIEVEWNEKSKKVHLRVIDARKLRAADSNGLSDPYVKVWLHKGHLGNRIDKSKQKTEIIYKNLNPVWDQTLIFANVTTKNIDDLYFHVEVMDYDVVGTNDFLGHAWIPIAVAVMQRGIMTVPLKEREDNTPWERPDTATADSRTPERNASAPARPPPPNGSPLVAPASPFLSMRSPSMGGEPSNPPSPFLAMRAPSTSSSSPKSLNDSHNLENLGTPELPISAVPAGRSRSTPSPCTECAEANERSKELEETNALLEEHVINLESRIASLKADIADRDEYLDALLSEVIGRCPEVLQAEAVVAIGKRRAGK